MPAPISFENLELDQNYVTVYRDRARGSYVNENNFVFYKQRQQRETFKLFLEPLCSDFSARTEFNPGALAERLLEDVAESVLVIGSIKENPAKVVEIGCVCCESYSLREIARLLALGFDHRDLSDLGSHRVIYEDKAFLGMATVAELIRKWSDSNRLQ